MGKLTAALICLGLFAGISGAEEVLSSAVAAARKDAAAFQASRPRSVRSEGSFVPEGCSVESWCLVKATDCFLGVVTRPGGLWQAKAQYSVVRKAVALCPVNYDRWERRTFMGPVEPQVFASGEQAERQSAEKAVVELCRVYRQDWVSAAPVCPAN
ncbi:MAG: hypothetical protein AAB320_01780 [Elusimicrobiota bacterium]